MAINTITLNTYLVRAADGSIDHEATCNKFRGDLLRYQAEKETEITTIGAAINAVMDNYPGTRFNMMAITSYTLKEMNVQPANFKVLTKKVQEYIRENVGERESGLPFGKKGGQNAAVWRWSDVPNKE